MDNWSVVSWHAQNYRIVFLGNSFNYIKRQRRRVNHWYRGLGLYGDQYHFEFPMRCSFDILCTDTFEKGTLRIGKRSDLLDCTDILCSACNNAYGIAGA